MPSVRSLATTIGRLTEILVVALAGRAFLRVRSSFAASESSEPQPDLAVVPRGEYDDAHPTRAFLVVEVAQSSLAEDRGAKARLYAETGVPEYWVVNLVERQIEVHTEIVDGRYARVRVARPGDTLRPVGFPDVEIRVDAVLGPAQPHVP